MPRLRLVTDQEDADREVLARKCAESICNHGAGAYSRLHHAAQAGDDDVIDACLSRMDERELSAAGCFAALRSDHYVGSLITFEEGRRCGARYDDDHITTNGGDVA